MYLEFMGISSITSSLIRFPAKYLPVDAFHLDAEIFDAAGLVVQGKEVDQAGCDVGRGHDAADEKIHVGESHALEDVQVDEGLRLRQ